MDYAIVQTGGKQYRVEPGSTIRVETVPTEGERSVKLDDVRLVSQDGDLTLGRPTVPGATVEAEVVTQGRRKKIMVLKYKNKTRYRVRKGHRQNFTELKITDISVKKTRKAKDS